jgi:hypothetical protein
MKEKLKENISKRYLILVVALSMILGTGIVVAVEETVEIRITPATLNLDQIDECQCVTVHAEIPYVDVDTETLTLNVKDADPIVYIDSSSTFSDNRGNLVVKFNRVEVTGIVAGYVGEEVTLSLTGKKLDETPFTGSGIIRVIDN